MADFHLRILATNRTFYDGECVSMTLPVTDGQLGLLAHHSPIAAAVVPGRLVCRLPDGSTLEAVCGGGILRFADNDALVLLDSAERPEEIDPARAREAAERARRLLRTDQTPQQRAQTQGDLARAEMRLRLAKGAK